MSSSSKPLKSSTSLYLRKTKRSKHLHDIDILEFFLIPISMVKEISASLRNILLQVLKILKLSTLFQKKLSNGKEKLRNFEMLSLLKRMRRRLRKKRLSSLLPVAPKSWEKRLSKSVSSERRERIVDKKPLKRSKRRKSLSRNSLSQLRRRKKFRRLTSLAKTSLRITSIIVKAWNMSYRLRANKNANFIHIVKILKVAHIFILLKE